MNKKKILTISLIFIITLSVLLFSYGFITTIINVIKEPKHHVFVNQNLKVEYSDGTEVLNSKQNVFTPGSVLTKTFTVKNVGNVNTTFNINLKEIKNNFNRKEDITYELKVNSEVLKDSSGNEIQGTFPSQDLVLLSEVVLEPNEQVTYELVINYINSEENQIEDSGSTITGKIIIEEFVSQNSSNIIVYGNSRQGILPEEYQQVEYLESSGTQYIDTGVIPDDTTGFKIKLSLPEVTTDIFRFGTRQDSGDSRYVLGSNAGRAYFGFDKLYNNNNWTISINTPFVANLNYLNSRYANIDDMNSVSINTLSTSFTYSLVMFGRNSYGTIASSAQKIYFLKITKSNELIRDFIPCYRKSDNVIGMYDLVENKFYTNDGTGEFTAGPIVAPTYENPIPVESLGVYDETNGKYNFTINNGIENFIVTLDEPLRKIGDYADYIDFSTGKIVRKIKSYTLTGNENILIFNGSYPYTYINIGDYGSVINDICLSTHFVHNSGFTINAQSVNTFRILNTTDVSSNARVGFRANENGVTLTDITQLQSSLATKYTSGNPVIFYHGVPEEYEIEENVELPEFTYNNIDELTVCSSNNVCASNIVELSG